jgi:glycosyltransferase involved in cell wall biosynthesis
MNSHSSGNRRTLIIVQNLPVPFDRRVWLEATTLASAGYTVSVICPKLKGFTKSYERLEGVDIYRYPLPFTARGVLGYFVEFVWCFVCTAILSLRVHLLGRGFDAIHACNPPETYWLLALVWRPLGKRFLFDHHDLSPEMYQAKYKEKHKLLCKALLWLEKGTFATAHTVIATNASHKEIACGRGRVPPDDVFIVRSGPDLERLSLRPPEIELKEGRRFLCCYLGEICEQDGVDYLVRAVKILCVDRGRRDILFAFLGGGPAQPELVQYAEAMGLTEYCRFTGHVSDDMLCRYLSTADVAIDPDPKTEWSDKSTMNKILEYMFFGCPIVAFDLKENRYSAKAAAVYVTSNSEGEMADAIEVILVDEVLRARMRQCGMKRVRSKLMWQHSIPHLLQAYTHLFRRNIMQSQHQSEPAKHLHIASNSAGR